MTSKKDLIGLKLLIYTHNYKVLKQKVLDDVWDLSNELYYIYKDKCSEERDGLNAKDKKNFYYKKLRLTDDY